MNAGTRKKIFLTAAVIVFCSMLLLAADTLKVYSHTVPIMIGPYREAAFTGLFLLLAISLVFTCIPINARTLCGTVFLALSVLWFTLLRIITRNDPDSAIPEVMGHFLPLALALFGAGAALLIGTFFAFRNQLSKPSEEGMADPKPDRQDDLYEPENDKRTERSKESSKFRISAKWQMFLILLLIFIILQPALKGGFYWDDAFFSVEAQSMRLTGESIFARVWKEITDYVRIGRINPFATFHFLVFYFIPDVRIYKLMLFLLSLLNGWLFYRFLRLWTKDHNTSILALLIVSLCFQFRIYHDPLNSYYGLMQVMFCELMGAMIHYLHWLQKGKKRNLIFSLLFFAMGLMSYEMFFPLTLIFLIPAWQQEKNLIKAIRRILPWVIIAVLIFSLSMLLRLNITEETAYNGTTFGLDLPVILRTFVTQVGAALPLSYRNSGNNTGLFGTTILWKDIFNTSLSVFVKNIQYQDILAGIIFILLLYQLPPERMKFSPYCLIAGLLLWLLPGIVISLSTKYQNELRPGLAYIPVYFSYFGMGLLLFETITLIGRLFCPQTIRLVLCGAGCAFLLLGMQDNRHISKMLDDIFLYPRKTGEAALQAGILGDSAPETVISAVPYSLWEHGWQWEPYQSKFYSLNSRMPMNAIGAKDYIEQFREEQPLWIQPSDTKLITYGGDERGGFAKCGTLTGTGFVFDDDILLSPVVSNVFIFLSGEYQSGVTLTYITRNAEWKLIPIEEIWPFRQTSEGTLYKLEEKVPLLFNTLGIRTF